VKLPPFRGQSAALRVSHTAGVPQGSPHVTNPDNNPRASVTEEMKTRKDGNHPGAWLAMSTEAAT
jgi:hypothetical protein